VDIGLKGQRGHQVLPAPWRGPFTTGGYPPTPNPRNRSQWPSGAIQEAFKKGLGPVQPKAVIPDQRYFADFLQSPDPLLGGEVTIGMFSEDLIVQHLSGQPRRRLVELVNEEPGFIFSFPFVIAFF
jgi:hypothetical protein